MPGHMLYAQCRCGFEQKLSCGSAITAGGFVGYTVAYSADGSDLQCADDDTINSQQLRTIPNPSCLMIRQQISSSNSRKGRSRRDHISVRIAKRSL